MEVRFVRFNIQDFLENLYVTSSIEEEKKLLEDFSMFYSKSKPELKTSVVKYIRSNRLYEENKNISSKIEDVLCNFSN